MRTRIALVLTSLTVLIALVVGGAPAAQAAPEGWATAGSTLKVTNNGYGHGRGMSQWGAQSRALDEQSAEDILGFYYPGTTPGKVTGLIRVWIEDDADANTIVRPAKGLRVIDLGNGRSYPLPTAGGATAWRLTVYRGKTRVAWLKKGTWRFYRPGGKLLTGAGEFRSSANLLTLYYDGANHRYRGAMRLVGGKTVNMLSMDNYLKGVIASEVFPSWEPAALQAQAIAARTYAANKRSRFFYQSYQICDSTSCQAYHGYDSEVASTNAAVIATAGRVLLHGGKPAFTEFSASNGGWSVAGNEPYLVAQEDRYDRAHRTTRTVDVAAIQKRYPAIGTLVRIRVNTRGTDQRVTKVDLDGTKADRSVTGDAIKSVLGLRTTYFAFRNAA